MEWIIFIEPRYKQRHWLKRNSSARPSIVSLGVAHPALGCLCNWKILSFHFLIWQAWVCFSLSHNMFTSWYILQLLTCRASKRNKTNLQAAEFGQSQRQQSLSWTYSKFVKKTEAYKNAFCLNQRLKPRHLCPEVVVHGVFWSQCALSQLAKADWLLAAVPPRTKATICLASAFECPQPHEAWKVLTDSLIHGHRSMAGFFIVLSFQARCIH